MWRTSHEGTGNHTSDSYAFKDADAMNLADGQANSLPYPYCHTGQEDSPDGHSIYLTPHPHSSSQQCLSPCSATSNDSQDYFGLQGDVDHKYAAETSSNCVPMTSESRPSTSRTGEEILGYPSQSNEGQELKSSNESTHVLNYADGFQFDMQSDPSLSHQEVFYQDSRHFGAQFNTHASGDTATAEKRNSIASTTSATTFYDCNDTVIATNPFSSSEPDNPDCTLEHFKLTPIPGNQNAQHIEVEYHLPSYDCPRPSIVVNDPTGLIASPVADDLHGLLLGDDSVTPRDLVSSLCEIVHALNKEWIRKLASTYDLYVHCSKLSTCSLFKVGIRTLQGCLHGTLPTTFKEVFALAHIGFAFSHVINKDGGSYYWDGFSSDLFRWHRALINPADLVMFVKVWDRLWCPKASPQMMLPGRDPSNVPLPRSASSPIDFYQDAGISANASMRGRDNESTNDLSMDHPHIPLLSTLMEGMMAKGCVNFLNSKSSLLMFIVMSMLSTTAVIEYAAMVERNADFSTHPTYYDPSDHFIENLEVEVTIPLQQSPAIELFYDHIAKTQSVLRRGLIRNIHELELTLISCDKVSNRRGPGPDPNTG